MHTHTHHMLSTAVEKASHILHLFRRNNGGGLRTLGKAGAERERGRTEKREKGTERGNRGSTSLTKHPDGEQTAMQEHTVSCEASDLVFARDKNKMCVTDAGLTAGAVSSNVLKSSYTG